MLEATPFLLDSQWLAHPPFAGHVVSEQSSLPNSMKGSLSARPILKLGLICIFYNLVR